MGRADPDDWEQSGDKPQFGFGPADPLDDPPQLDRPPIKYFAFLRDDDACGKVVDLAGDRWQGLAVFVLARLMVEAQPYAGLRQAKFAAHRRRRPPQIVCCERRKPKQFTDARCACDALAVLCHHGAFERARHRLA